MLHKTIRPFREFMRIEASGGMLLLACTVVALLWANLPFGWTYDLIWETQFSIMLGSVSISGPLGFWVNDFLMAIFFFLIGLEIKRELLIGWLCTRGQAILPVIGAVGGMVFPALFYLILNPPGSPGAAGWAIPMATDIAICLGVVALFGNHIPTTMKVFLTTLAIADDIGGIMIIAIFYSHGIHLEFIVLALAIIVLLIIINRLGIRPVLPYILGGLGLWVSLLFGGLHPTLAGVLLAAAVPASTKIDYREFAEIHNQMHDRLDKLMSVEHEYIDFKSFIYTTQTVEKACHDVEAPLQRIDARLAPWVVFVIMPIFALANAGVRIEADFFGMIGNPIAIGIILGLVLGKPIGVLGFIWLSQKLGVVKLGESMSWDLLSGVTLLTGIGFTISMFIGDLSFPSGVMLESAKVGILLGSLISGILAILRINTTLARQDNRKDR
jgi:NhaA family Na+:H+ antiporter